MFLLRKASLISLVVLIAILFSVGSAVGGWKWEQPPNMVVPDCGRRNPIFYVGEPVKFDLPGKTAVRYEVRNYYGDVVDKGPAGPSITLEVKDPGWYKLYLYGEKPQDPWADSVGGTMFTIFRKHPGFPALPPRDVPNGEVAHDCPTRGVLGFGTNRHSVKDAGKPDEEIAKLESDIALDRKYLLSYNPTGERELLVAFPNGTENLEGVHKIVEHFKDSVRYWEPRNEPNFKMSGADFALKEMKPFYETVKSVDPKLKVLGPGTVTIGPYCLGWIEDFLKAGGGKYIDGFSFHSYNNSNGDLWLTRKSLDELNKILAKYGIDTKEKWQTEQGFMAAVYGSYQPRLQGRWTMLQTMVFEQYGIPNEHNVYWYDRSHGFWDVPVWWENEGDSGNGLNPAAALMRVWAEETYGTRLLKAYDFGPTGNKLTVGSLFEGKGRRVAAFISAGSTDGRVDLKVTGGKTLHTVSAFGIAKDIPVKGGKAVLTVPELPVYVELAKEQSIQVVPEAWGENLARLPGVTVATSGKTTDAAKLINGELENWYYAQGDSPGPWKDDTPGFPAWVEIRLPAARTIDRAIVYAFPPWQVNGTLVDYELQYDKAGQWVTIERITEPTKTFKVYTPTVRCTVDSFFSDRWIFRHQFKPVKTSKIRLLIHDVTWGGGATKDVPDAGGQAGPHVTTLREIEVFGPKGT